MRKLQEKYQNIQKNMIQQMPESILNAFSQSLAQLIELNLEAQALKVGDTAPDFTLPSSDGRLISLYNVLKESKDNVILSFFRGNWCPFCVAELSHYQEAINEKIIDTASILAISPQTTEFNHIAAIQNNLQFNLLSDQENIRDIYKELGADLELFNGDTSYQLPIPATYIIGKDRKIKFASVNTNYMERADICNINNFK